MKTNEFKSSSYYYIQQKNTTKYKSLQNLQRKIVIEINKIVSIFAQVSREAYYFLVRMLFDGSIDLRDWLGSGQFYSLQRAISTTYGYSNTDGINDHTGY